MKMMVIEQWQQEFQAVLKRIGPRFARLGSRRQAGQYLQGLLSQVQRKNGWQLAEMLGQNSPYGLQQFLYRAKWDADEVRDDLRVYVDEHLADPAGVLVIDETGFIKKGSHSVGVQVQPMLPLKDTPFWIGPCIYQKAGRKTGPAVGKSAYRMRSPLPPNRN